jgi:outer membrane immunogenic protein
MKKILGLTLAGALSVAALPAVAADYPMKAPPPPIWTWTGFYVGVSAGAGWLASHIFNNSGNYIGTGGAAGVTVGWNWQAPGSPWVLGIEGDWLWSNMNAAVGIPTCGPNCVTNTKWLGTIRGRFGHATGPLLFYLTGGVAFGSFQWGQPPGYFNRISDTGWTMGAGIEGALGGNWTWKAEYLYLAFEQDKVLAQIIPPGCPSPPGFSCGDYNRIHLLRGGVNYKF